MAIINKTGIGNGNTIQAEHITRIIDTLTNSTGSHVTVSGSFTGAATLSSATITSATITGGTATLTSATINGTLINGQSNTAGGSYSHAEGGATTSTGQYSHAEGQSTIALNLASHAEGYSTDANGNYSHTEGYETVTGGQAAHAEGYQTSGSGNYSHAEGNRTLASNSYAHAEGDVTTASGISSHAEGSITIASGSYSHAEGYSTIAQATYGHAEGSRTWALGNASHTEGYNTTSSGWYSHAEGNTTVAVGNYGHAEGDTTNASGSYSHAEGYANVSIGSYSHAEGRSTVTTAVASGAHTEGYLTTASNAYAHAEGEGAQSSGQSAHAEGFYTIASGNYSHAEGSRTLASNTVAHAEGASTTASGQFSHSEGQYTLASGAGAHAEGLNTTASGNYSHAEGTNSITVVDYSHAEGIFTIASGSGQHVSGKYNKHGDSTSLTIIGDGTNDASRSDIFKTKVGAVEISGSLNILSRGATSATDAVTIRNSSNIDLLTVQNDGNVGIGESAPPSRLYISASAPALPTGSVVLQTFAVRHLQPNSDYLEISNTRISGSLDWGGAGYRLQTRVDQTYMGYMQFNANNDQGISFGTGFSTISGSLVPERMRITSAGSVGIGTTAPSFSLHVKGNGSTLALEGIDHTYMSFWPDGYTAGRKGYIGYASSGENWLTIANEDASKGVALKAGGYVRQYVDPNGRISFGTADTATPSHSIELLQQFGISPNSDDYTDIVQNMYWHDPSGWRSRQGGPGSLIRMRGGSNSGSSAAASGSIEFVVFGAPPNVPYGTSLTPTQSMWIDANAYVGIGSSWNNYDTRPDAPLHVVGSAGVGSNQGGTVQNVGIKVDSTYNYNQGVALLLGSKNGNAPFIAAENTGSILFITKNTNRIVIDGDSGRVGIGFDNPGKTLDVNGTARINSIPFTGNSRQPLYYETDGFLVANTSDIRFKTNISTLTGSLDKVNNLRGVTFNWINEPTGSAFVGFIAQEVESVIPELVFTDKNGPEQYKGVYYAEMTALLVEAVKTLSAENESLKSELQTIKTHLGL